MGKETQTSKKKFRWWPFRKKDEETTKVKEGNSPPQNLNKDGFDAREEEINKEILQVRDNALRQNKILTEHKAQERAKKQQEKEREEKKRQEEENERRVKEEQERQEREVGLAARRAEEEKRKRQEEFERQKRAAETEKKLKNKRIEVEKSPSAEEKEQSIANKQSEYEKRRAAQKKKIAAARRKREERERQEELEKQQAQKEQAKKEAEREKQGKAEKSSQHDAPKERNSALPDKRKTKGPSKLSLTEKAVNKVTGMVNRVDDKINKAETLDEVTKKLILSRLGVLDAIRNDLQDFQNKMGHKTQAVQRKSTITNSLTEVEAAKRTITGLVNDYSKNDEKIRIKVGNKTDVIDTNKKLKDDVEEQFELARKYLFVEMRETRKDHAEVTGSGICFFKSRTGRAYEKTLKTQLGLNKQKFNEAVQQYHEEPANPTPTIAA